MTGAGYLDLFRSLGADAGGADGGRRREAPVLDGSADDDAWSERAALVAANGTPPGLAERVADASVPPLAGDPLPVDWPAWVRREVGRRAARMGVEDAERRVFGLAVTLWHLHHGARPVDGRCAGCGGPIGARAWVMPDGARLHDDRRALSCLEAYGERWRPAAVRALAALGVVDPECGR